MTGILSVGLVAIPMGLFGAGLPPLSSGALPAAGPPRGTPRLDAPGTLRGKLASVLRGGQANSRNGSKSDCLSIYLAVYAQIPRKHECR